MARQAPAVALRGSGLGMSLQRLRGRAILGTLGEGLSHHPGFDL